MKKLFLMPFVAFVAAGLGVDAQETTKGPPARPEATKSTPAVKATATAPAARGADEKAITALLDAFTKAFNAGDATAAAATYTESAIVVDEQGERIEGRAAIRDQYAASFADNPGSAIAIQVDSLRFLGPETALEEGRATITPAGGDGAPEITRFTAVYVKHGGRWLQAAVRDELAHDLTPHERLKALEWLVGDWVNESQDAVVHTTCKWTDDGNFLVRDFTMKTRGEPVLSGTQRIGWDPLTRRFKTWIFDSEGGHGDGSVTNDGDRWVIKVEGVGRDGLPSSATNIVTRLGKDRMSWQSVDRTLGGSAIDGIDEFVVVRTPPEVGK
jgi:uncharacterized protein (TIGR02246 family)